MELILNLRYRNLLQKSIVLNFKLNHYKIALMIRVKLVLHKFNRHINVIMIDESWLELILNLILETCFGVDCMEFFPPPP